MSSIVGSRSAKLHRFQYDLICYHPFPQPILYNAGNMRLLLLSILLTVPTVVGAKRSSSMAASSDRYPMPFLLEARSTASLTTLSSLRGGAVPTRVVSKLKASISKVGRRASKEPAISGTGSATVLNEIFNLVKGIVGVGVLSLPAGIANFGDHPSVLIPALIMIAGMGLLSGYGFAIIGKVCSYCPVPAQSYRDAWAQSIGPGTSWIPAVSATCKTFLACLALSMVLADTFVGLLRYTPEARTPVLMALTTLLLLPLCWMKNLSALAPFSLLGILGMGFTALAMTVRYLDGSYAVGTGALVSDVAAHLRPAFGSHGWSSVLQPNALILLCMLSTAYMAHFNAPKFYQELYNNTLPRFHFVVASSFGISILLMGFITAIGFLTFGSASAGLVLNNYSPHDVWMSASRVAVAVALVFSYPLAFQGCRDGLLDLLPVPRSTPTLNALTVVLLGLLTALAAALKDVSFVLALGGGTHKC
jgi:amino acid permease